MDPDGSVSGSIGSVSPRRSTRGPRFGLGAEGARSLLIATVSTVAVFGLIGFVVVNSEGWPRVQAQFLDGEIFWEALPKIVAKFWVNIQLFVIAEVMILVLGLLLAVMRSLPGPVFFPLRLMATLYVDVFRAMPGLLVIVALGIGLPALRIPGVPKDEFFWAIVVLTLLYSAYVSEVYRAGIESVHASQSAAARSLGLSQIQTMRHVIVPQAIRRVIPPLLNDFIGLQKDTVLVSYIGVVEIFRQSQIIAAAKFNFTPYVATALVFLVVTIPLARFTDWLIARERRKGRSGPGVPGARRSRIFGFGR
ncbi:MAG TPA: amino acid ABC transporter permease [Candidatus Limnocylindrales bacterium]|nr:amino acid ABC transporter permease [Candidatus Limnocylindrales bacterium]